MHTTSTLILVGILCLAAGALLAFFATRGRQSLDRTQELELRLKEANTRLEDFQLQVNEHFDQTAQLVNNLTQSYREVHEHLATSAMRLSNQDIGRQMLEAGSGNLSDNDEHINVLPPRDWAPTKGALSEEYGIEKEEQAPSPSPVNAIRR